MVGVIGIDKAAKSLDMCTKEFRTKFMYKGHIEPLPRDRPAGKLRFKKRDLVLLHKKIERGELIL